MKVEDYPDLDFDSCDACRGWFKLPIEPVIIGLGQPQAFEHAPRQQLVIALCAPCCGVIAGKDRQKGKALGDRAEATARLRPGRLRDVA